MVDSCTIVLVLCSCIPLSRVSVCLQSYIFLPNDFDPFVHQHNVQNRLAKKVTSAIEGK